MYDTVDEARQKLCESTVLLNGDPVYISDMSGKVNHVILKYYKLPLNFASPEELSINDPGWDFRTGGTKLGYSQIKHPFEDYHYTVFLSRTPIRTSRQGLDNKTVMIYQPEQTEYTFGFSDFLKSGGLKETIRNEFLSVKQAFNLVTENFNYKGAPFHRRLALFYDQVSPPYLVYRNVKIGYTEDGKSFKLAKHKRYLQEELVDMVGLKIVGDK